MATVRYNVPQEVVSAFNAAFAGQNKSAIVAELMRGVVQSKARRVRSRQAIASILARRPKAPLRDAAALAARPGALPGRDPALSRGFNKTPYALTV